MYTRSFLTGKRILVTGAAGFIGFHVASALQKRGDFVVGVDNFNAYYDVQLKRAREKLLGVDVVACDITDTTRMKALVQQNEITHVVHLAAQAGVRHSIKHPGEYVSSNLNGFVSVLEACVSRPGVKLVYASSSSVYGLNTKIPFSPDDPTDRPANLYGATKKANEAMAHAYHHLHGLPVTGLRFFTVYGPWGRPDMAYFRFTEQILSGQPIQVFNQGKMRRDFTYIDDIVDGVLAAVDLGAGCEIFNLGNNRPVELMEMIQLLEAGLGKKAVCEMLPMQPGEALETFADIRKSGEMLGFQPKTALAEGLSKFIAWYREYHEN